MYLYREGIDVVTISKLLGHDKPSYTMGYLDHLTNGEAIRALHNYDRSSLSAKKAPPLSKPEDWFDYDEQW